MIITKYGYGKNVRVSEFKVQNRGGVGVKCVKFRKTLKDDCVRDAVIVSKENELMIMTKSGTMCRQQIKTISTQRRESMGVIIVKIDPKDEVIGIEQVEKIEESEGLGLNTPSATTSKT